MTEAEFKASLNKSVPLGFHNKQIPGNMILEILNSVLSAVLVRGIVP